MRSVRSLRKLAAGPTLADLDNPLDLLFRDQRRVSILHHNPFGRRVHALRFPSDVPNAVTGELQKTMRMKQAVPCRVTPELLTWRWYAFLIAEVAKLIERRPSCSQLDKALLGPLMNRLARDNGVVGDPDTLDEGTTLLLFTAKSLSDL